VYGWDGEEVVGFADMFEQLVEKSSIWRLVGRSLLRDSSSVVRLASIIRRNRRASRYVLRTYRSVSTANCDVELHDAHLHAYSHARLYRL
jgi:hypothetical protein